jgi:hypothetical protein
MGCFRYIVVNTLYKGFNKDNNNNNNNNNNNPPQADCGQKWAFDAKTKRRRLYFVLDYKIKRLKYEYRLLNNYYNKSKFYNICINLCLYLYFFAAKQFIIIHNSFRSQLSHKSSITQVM